jgi:peptidoglycan/xylan/chitin deacetylase (PgdA/CDA1 family)
VLVAAFACGRLPSTVEPSTPHVVVDDEFVPPPLLQAPDDWLAGADLPPKTLALTFDDGPGEHTLRIARYLADQGVSATFFVVGERAAGREWILDELTRLGHTVGNHSHVINPATNNHWLLGADGGPDPAGNVAACDAVIAPRVRDDVYLFRAPFFFYTKPLEQELLADPRTRFYLGSVRARIGTGSNSDDTPDAGYMGDWQCWSGLASATSQAPHPFTAEECAQIYLREITSTGNPYGCGAQGCDHGVVLMHDYDATWERAHQKEHDLTAKLVEQLVPQLKSLGYRFTTLEELPGIAAKLNATTNPNLRPAHWNDQPRGHSVHWHRLRVAESSPTSPGTISHSFERDTDHDALSWDEQPLAGCAKEIAAITTRHDMVALATLGCGGEVMIQSFSGGDTPDEVFETVAKGKATALLDLVEDDDGKVTLRWATADGNLSHTWRPQSHDPVP